MESIGQIHLQHPVALPPRETDSPQSPWTSTSSCVTSKHARDAKISEGVWDPQSHTTVCGGCASAGWQSQAAKRSSGFPRGKHLTNPADGAGSGQRQAAQSEMRSESIMIMKLHLGLGHWYVVWIEK